MLFKFDAIQALGGIFHKIMYLKEKVRFSRGKRLRETNRVYNRKNIVNCYSRLMPLNWATLIIYQTFSLCDAHNINWLYLRL